MNAFQILTPVTYWLLVGLWVYILGFLLQRLRRSNFEKSLLNVLIVVLAINALRTLFESLYFGAWYTSKSGFLPIGVYDVLVRPEIVILPKILNVISALVIIGILLYRWFPAEKRDREWHERTMEDRTCELRESEERFRMICENAPVLINGFDEQGLCVMWNEQCQATFGWTLGEVNAHDDALALFYPDPAVRDEALRTVMNDPDGTFREWHPITKNGETLTTEWANFRLPNGQVFSIGHDITERKRAAEALTENEQRLKEAQRMTSIGNWEQEVQSNTLMWSDEVFRIFEIDQETSGESVDLFFSAVHPDDQEVVANAYNDSLITKKPYEIIHRLLMPDGRVKYVHECCETEYDESGNPVKSRGTVQDITERKQAEVQLSEQLEELRRWQVALVGRESRVIEMKQEVNELLIRLDEPPRYASATETGLEE